MINADQISDQLNRVNLWSEIWSEFKSNCIAPTWFQFSGHL